MQVFSIRYELHDGTQYDGLLFSTRPKALEYIGQLSQKQLRLAGIVEVSIVAKEVL